VLDVGTGSGGTVAVPAAQRGARVVGSDITDSWFDVARRRAQEAGVEVEWVQADVEDLPFEDGRFDRVVSTFGHMFAPHHEAAAAEMARVCRSGGMIATATWLPEGPNGEMFKLLGSKMPPPPEGVTPPPMWGVQDHVEAMWAPHGLELEFAVTSVAFEGPSVDEFADTFLENFGPMVMARAALGDAGTIRLEPTYLVTLARKP
jgi:SAM-dependent methyltransferase